MDRLLKIQNIKNDPLTRKELIEYESKKTYWKRLITGNSKLYKIEKIEKETIDKTVVNIIKLINEGFINLAFALYTKIDEKINYSRKYWEVKWHNAYEEAKFEAKDILKDAKFYDKLNTFFSNKLNEEEAEKDKLIRSLLTLRNIKINCNDNANKWLDKFRFLYTLTLIENKDWSFKSRVRRWEYNYKDKNLYYKHNKVIDLKISDSDIYIKTKYNEVHFYFNTYNVKKLDHYLQYESKYIFYDKINSEKLMESLGGEDYLKLKVGASDFYYIEKRTFTFTQCQFKVMGDGPINKIVVAVDNWDKRQEFIVEYRHTTEGWVGKDKTIKKINVNPQELDYYVTKYWKTL